MPYEALSCLTPRLSSRSGLLRWTSLVLLPCILLIPPLHAQDPDLLDPALRGLLHEALSGELAKEHVIQITRHHRVQGSRGYRDAAKYVLDELRRAGFKRKEAFIESFKSDGKVHYQTWQSPSGWDIDWAELRLLEPREERLVGYPEIAMSVITYSNPGDVTAELVWVGPGTSDADYEGQDVKGKFVLATGYGGSVHRLAVLKYGAAAVVAYLDDNRAKEHPDMLQYTGMWPRTEELDRVTFGFNLTNRQGEQLRQLLESGRKVVLRGQVQGIGLEPYEMDVVVALIRGSKRPDEELVFCAHLDHPKESANDNASGSAALLDIAQTLRRLIDEGRLPQPKRTLRFLWVPEWSGMMAYIDGHPELKGPALGGKVLANLNLDMVGENLELLHSKLFITRTPHSLPSVVNDVVANMARMVDGMNIRTPRGSLSAFNYRIIPYSGGSDHMMFIERKIPGIMLCHSDYTHHTSEDTPDKVDPVELERCEIIAAAAMLYLANLETGEALDLVQLTAANSAQRLGLAGRRAHQWIAAASPDEIPTIWAEAQNLLDMAAYREKATIASVLQFNDAGPVKAAIEQMGPTIQHQLATLSKALRSTIATRGVDVSQGMPPLHTDPDQRIPVRVTWGPLDFGLPESKLPSEAVAWYRAEGSSLTGNVRFELINFIDGNRTVSDIRNLVSAEYGPFDLAQGRPIDQAVVSRYLDDLVRVGVMKWK